MAKKLIKINHINFFHGFDDVLCREKVFMDLCNQFDFQIGEFGKCDFQPDVLLINCYGPHRIPETNAIKVGYYTESIDPELSCCDYFFGCEYREVINHPKYCRAVYGQLNSRLHEACNDPDRVLATKKNFAAYVYTHRIKFREKFCLKLARYRNVACPGLSLKNCNDLDQFSRWHPDWHPKKIEYLSTFKFTIAFENSRRPGYVTEKLFDAYEANSIPIYWGDPMLDKIINLDSVVLVKPKSDRDLISTLKVPEKRIPMLPNVREKTIWNKFATRWNDCLNRFEENFPRESGFDEAIQEIIELDQDPVAYKNKLSQARLKPSALQLIEEYYNFWTNIFIKVNKQVF